MNKQALFEVLDLLAIAIIGLSLVVSTGLVIYVLCAFVPFPFLVATALIAASWCWVFYRGQL